jgi:hypothetical protein
MPQDIDGVPHVIMPVLHPSGDVDRIAVPADTPLADVHSALSDYYHQAQPDAQGSVENNPVFKNAAAQAVAAMHASEMRGRGGHEAGFSMSRTGQASKVDIQPDEEASGKGHMTQTFPANTIGSLHTHDSGHKDIPGQDNHLCGVKNRTPRS